MQAKVTPPCPSPRTSDSLGMKFAQGGRPITGARLSSSCSSILRPEQPDCVLRACDGGMQSTGGSGTKKRNAYCYSPEIYLLPSAMPPSFYLCDELTETVGKVWYFAIPRLSRQCMNVFFIYIYVCIYMGLPSKVSGSVGSGVVMACFAPQSRCAMPGSQHITTGRVSKRPLYGVLCTW